MIQFSEKAYNKMLALVGIVDKEVGWHGTVEFNNDEFLVTDIFVYPQQVTNATVRADDEGLIKWFSELDDEIFNSLRLWGHSHCFMASKPSSLDYETEYNFIKSMFPENHYVSIIINKHGEITERIYYKDAKGNIEVFKHNDKIINKDWVIQEEIAEEYIEWAKNEIEKYVKQVEI